MTWPRRSARCVADNANWQPERYRSWTAGYLHLVMVPVPAAWLDRGKSTWRGTVSIGESLAEARRQAGLTIYEVSQQTRIRESIIRRIEEGDFSASGGDFYARGHIRSIAGAVGIDPAPLIREYDAEHGPLGQIRAAEVFEPSTPLK